MFLQSLNGISKRHNDIRTKALDTEQQLYIQETVEISEIYLEANDIDISEFGDFYENDPKIVLIAIIIASSEIQETSSISSKKLKDCAFSALGLKEVVEGLVEGQITRAVAKKIAKKAIKKIAVRAIPYVGEVVMIAEFIYCLYQE